MVGDAGSAIIAAVANGHACMKREQRTHSPPQERLGRLTAGRRRNRPRIRLALGIASARKVHQRIAKEGELLDMPARVVLVDEGRYKNEIFVVEGGVVLLSKALPDGRRQVVGFRFAGDLIGLGESNGTWSVTVQAIAPSRVRRIPGETLSQVLESEPSLCRWLLARAGDEIAAAQGQLLTVGRRNKEERLAAFILEIWHRTKGRPSRPPEVVLAMHRPEIADYLGLTTETVSRVLVQFARGHFIALPHPSRIKLLNRSKLEDLALGRRAYTKGH